MGSRFLKLVLFRKNISNNIFDKFDIFPQSEILTRMTTKSPQSEINQHRSFGADTSLIRFYFLENSKFFIPPGLRRRALGLFKTSSTTALLHKIAKHSSEAANISKRVQELESLEPSRRSSSSSDSLTKPALKKNLSLQMNPLPKYLWIRIALFEKQLAKIIDYLVSNANKYYDKDALVADPDYGSILSSLLVGPCALDYSRTKTPDHFWTDPPADELVSISLHLNNIHTSKSYSVFDWH